MDLKSFCKHHAACSHAACSHFSNLGNLGRIPFLPLSGHCSSFEETGGAPEPLSFGACEESLGGKLKWGNGKWGFITPSKDFGGDHLWDG